MRVLVVEDEIRMAVLLKRALEEEGHAVDVAADGPEGQWMATENAYAAIVLDVMLPGFDGIQLCRRLREAGIWVPVLMLTARDSVGDRVRGLDAGADDYLVKPFSLLELAARLRALSRRDDRSRPGGQTRVAGRHRTAPVPEGVRAAGDVPAAPGPRPHPLTGHRGHLGLRLRRRIERRRPVRELPAAQDRHTVRPARHRDGQGHGLPAPPCGTRAVTCPSGCVSRSLSRPPRRSRSPSAAGCSSVPCLRRSWARSTPSSRCSWLRWHRI